MADNPIDKFKQIGGTSHIMYCKDTPFGQETLLTLRIDNDIVMQCLWFGEIYHDELEDIVKTAVDGYYENASLRAVQ